MINQMEIEEYYQFLIHVCHCLDESCKLPKCNRIRRIIDHVKICRIIVKRNCAICTQMLKICFYHAKHCHNAGCTIPLCSRMKQTIMDQHLKERIEQAELRRLRLVEMMRLPADRRASRRSPGSR